MKKRIKIAADKNIPFLKGVLDNIANVKYLPWQEMTRQNLHDADALITRTRTLCDRALLEGTAVKMIATASIGFDHIDTDYCDSHGISWTNAPGCNSSSVEQYMVSSLMSIAHKKQLSLAGMTIGIVGVGYVGSKVEKASKALGMKVLLNDPPRARTEGPGHFTDLTRILQESDIITMHVPLNHGGKDNTYHLVNADFFKNLGKKAILINTSRGEVVDGRALKDAIIQERLSGSVLDVWEGEPEIDLELLGLVDIATSHIAGYSADGKAKAISMSVQALSRFFHLGMDEWYPGELPPPSFDQFAIDAAEKGLQDVVSEAVSKTYNIMNDDKTLRSAPDHFEQLRADYPVRRETRVYKIRIVNDTVGAGPVLEKLGFRVLVDHCK